MDNLFLAKILKEHARLIIPGFGAFLRKEGHTTALVFSPFLKKDDGVLSALLCEEYGVSNFDGEAMIAEWVQHIREAMASNGKYHIEGIGLLILDANGAIAMVEEPRKPTPAVQPAAPAQSTSQTAVQPRPLVQQESVVPVVEIAAPVAPAPVATPAPAQSTIAQQIVEQIQQTPSRPLVAPQPIGQAAPRVAPRPITPPQNAMGGINAAAPQGMPPRPAAAHMNPNGPRPAGAPQGGQPIHQGPQGVPTGAPQGGIPTGARPAGGPQGPGPQRPQGAGNPQRPGQRPPQRPNRKSKKYSSTEIWLIVAIVAALVVTAIIIWSLLVLSPKEEFYTTDEVATDSTTMVDTLTVTQTPAN